MIPELTPREYEVANLRSSARKSRRAIPASIVVLVITGGAAVLLNRWLRLPWFLVAILPVVALLTLLVDVINYLYCRRRLRQLERLCAANGDSNHRRNQ